ncbi:MAG TPA: hypothetical protein VFG20_06760 [Planctomycetaceae bacterium]|jgi:hypothetical protein|nr:hypothetical protein [Planctomycetaceae bacterium]
MANPPRGPGILFHLTAAATTAFIISILAMVATLFGDPAAPINLWINDYAGAVLGIEIAAIAVLGTAAMMNDARVTRRERQESHRETAQR